MCPIDFLGLARFNLSGGCDGTIHRLEIEHLVAQCKLCVVPSLSRG